MSRSPSTHGALSTLFQVCRVLQLALLIAALALAASVASVLINKSQHASSALIGAICTVRPPPPYTPTKPTPPTNTAHTDQHRTPLHADLNRTLLRPPAPAAPLQRARHALARRHRRRQHHPTLAATLRAARGRHTGVRSERDVHGRRQVRDSAERHGRAPHGDKRAAEGVGVRRGGCCGSRRGGCCVSFFSFFFYISFFSSWS